MGDTVEVSYIANPRARKHSATKVSTSRFGPETARAVNNFHRSLPGYLLTPLVDLAHLARDLGVANLWVKDESPRFGLNAFKVLGASYAAAKTVAGLLGLRGDDVSFDVFESPDVRSRLEDLTLITATDGNHGRAVAWMAERLGCNAVVYMPRGSSPARFDAIAAHGADTSIIDGNYDDAVRQADADARAHGWTLIQDTAWKGYEEIPYWIMEGYLTIVLEAMAQLKSRLPTHVLVQCGVGSLAGAVQGQLCKLFGERRPMLAVVEPVQAACCFHSMAAGATEPRKVEGAFDTIMAGLACGDPSTIAWRILRDYTDVFCACADSVSERGMRLLAHPRGDDLPIVSGESGAVTAGLLATILGRGAPTEYAELTAALKLDRRSSVLLISTEGDTDPESYKRIVGTSSP